MSSDFLTPGRQPNGRTDGSSNRRVMRSALETLLETQSPYLQVSSPSPLTEARPQQAAKPRTDHDAMPPGVAAPPPPPKGFTVTYAAQAPAATHSSGGSKHRASSTTARAVEEPSTLLFLERDGATRKGDHSGVAPDVSGSASTAERARGRSGSGGDGRRLDVEGDTPPARGRSQPQASPVPSPDASRSLLKDVELAEGGPAEAVAVAGGGEGRRRQNPTPSSTAALAGRGTSRTARQPKDEEDETVHRRIAEAVAAFEKQRDEEEAAVLRQIDVEIGEKERINRELLSEKQEVMRVAKALQAQLTEVVRQCEELQEQKSAALEEQGRLREALGRAEVELCHSNDALRLQQRLGEESSEAVRQLQEQVATLTAEGAAKDAALAEAQRTYMAECEDIKDKMLSLGKCMSDMEATLEDRDRAIAQLQRRLEEAEKASRVSTATVASAQEEGQAMEKRVAELQELLQGQTDEVRRRMAKITVLHAEQKTLRQQSQAMAEAVRTTAEHQAALQSSLEALLTQLKQQMRGIVQGKVKAAAKESPRGAGASQPSPPPPNALDGTNPFGPNSSDEDEDAASSLITMSDEERGREGGARATGAGAARARSASPYSAKASRVVAAAAVGGRSAKGQTRPLSTPSAHTATVESAEEAMKALRHSSATCLRLTRDLTTTSALYSRRVQRRLSALAAEGDARSAATDVAQDLAKRLEAACRYLKSKLTESEAEATQSKAECEAMGKDLALLEAEADQVHTEKQALEARVAELEAAQAASAVAQESLEKEVVRLHEQLQDAAGAVRQLETEKAAVETALSTAEAAAAKVPALEEARLTAEQALAKEAASVARLTERLKRAEEDKAAAAAERTEGEQKLRAALEALEVARAEAAAQRAKENREAQHTAAETKRLTNALDTIKADCASLRLQLAKEKSAAEEASGAQEAQLAAAVAAARTHRGQIAELVREMELRRSGEHATLQAILDAVHAAVGVNGGTSDGTDSDTGDKEEGDPAAAAETTPARGDSSALSWTGPGVSPLSRLPASPGQELPSPPSAAAGGVRVALLPDSLSTEKRRRKGKGKGLPAAAGTTTTPRKRTTALLRREAVKGVQRAVMELTKLQEIAAEHAAAVSPPLQQQQQQLRSLLGEDSFRHAEAIAKAAAEHSAQRRQGGGLPAGATAAAVGVADAYNPFPSARLFPGASDDCEPPAAAVFVEPFFDSHFFFDRSPAAAAAPSVAAVSRTPALRPPFPYPSSVSPSPSPVAPSRGTPATHHPPTQHPFAASSGTWAAPRSLFSNLAVNTASVYNGPSVQGTGKRVSLSSGFPRTRAGSDGGTGLSLSPLSSLGRSGSGDVDGSCSPARPPSLQAASAS